MFTCERMNYVNQFTISTLNYIILYKELSNVSTGASVRVELVIYLCEVHQHPCGWVSNNRETRVKRRWGAVEQRVDVNVPLSHPGNKDDDSHISLRIRVHFGFKDTS